MSAAPLAKHAKRWKKGQLQDLVFFQRGFDLTQAQQTAGPFPVISSSGITSYHSEFKASGPGVVIGRKGTLGSVHFSDVDYWPHDTTLWSKDLGGNNPRFDLAEVTMGQSPESKHYNQDGEGLPFHQGVTDFGDRFVTHRIYSTALHRIAELGDILCSVRAPDERRDCGLSPARSAIELTRWNGCMNQQCTLLLLSSTVGNLA